MLFDFRIRPPFKSFLTTGGMFGGHDGQAVTRCTYTVTNYPGRTGDVQVNLYLCGDVIIGGDIMALGENGFQASLPYPAENT